MEKKPTQYEKVLEALLDAKGEWVNGQVFLHKMYLSQYHTRIHELQNKGHKIEASEFTDGVGFKSYRILPEGQLKLI